MGRNGGGWRDFVYAQIILGFIFGEAREVDISFGSIIKRIIIESPRSGQARPREEHLSLSPLAYR